MDPALQAFAAGLPEFLLQGSVALVLCVAGVGLYARLTPLAEVRLIREGNVAAGIALTSVVLGVSIVMAAALASAHSLVDLVVWGVFASALQLLAFRITDMILHGLPRRIREGQVAAALLLAGIKIGAALVTAAALSG